METRNADRIAEIPQWDVVLNHELFPLYSGRHTPHFAVITRMGLGARVEPGLIDWKIYKDGLHAAELWLVSSDDFRATQQSALMGLMGRLGGYPGFKVRGHVHATQEVVEAIHEAFRQRLQSGGESNSDEHRLFDKIGQDALEKRASDIHITLFPETAEVKFRVKGELKHYMDLSRDRGENLVASAYNTLFESGSTKKGFNEREYQDAVIERLYPQGLVRFRYSGLPIAPSGADITLRLIPIGVETGKRSLRDLGYSEDQVEVLERVFSRSAGMVLVAGTTGSGKSTTLAVAVEDIADQHPGKKIRTVEDPVEYRIRGAYQTPVIGDFMLALRQIMRSDPDVIMVGEIRDIETANVSIQGVRSGHLLLSTIHANGAPVCFDRLAGMGVSRQDLATIDLIAAFVYQKLVPVLCEHCKVPFADYAASTSADMKLLRRLRKSVGDDVQSIFFRKHDGCPHCDHDGITHREVVAEILRPTPAMSHAIAAGDSMAIWKLWRATINENDPSDMTGRTAFEHALYKMRQGRVAPQDVEAAFKFVDESPFEIAEH